ncbi:MAG TPA: peptidylprolyl isomerase, partial [Tissierellaceae bacterium]|nr:peptidylprolyl isomerase [Tissierellaceae bacterium]
MNKKVLAKVGGKEITQEDVFKFLREVGPQVAANFQSPEGMEKVVEELVSQELLYLDAVENKLNEDEEYNRILEETKAMLLKNYAIS